LGVGIALHAIGDSDGAIAAYREALRLNPALPNALVNLGNALAAKEDPEGAIALYREAIRIRPDDANARRNLGVRLMEKGDIQGATAEWHEALRIEPDFAAAHSDLGHAYLRTGDLDGAIREATEAMRLDPRWGADRMNLGIALSRKGRYREALSHLREAVEMNQPGSIPRQEFVQSVARMAEVEARLPAVLQGTAKPADAAEWAALARICAQRGQHADAARLYAEGFAAHPRLADDLEAGHRYDAACAAVRSGVPEGRRRALAWLTADLAARTGSADADAALVHWRKDPDLASVRDRIDGLPEAERDGWRKLWADVNAALQEK